MVNYNNNVPFIFESFHSQQDSLWHEKASWKCQTTKLPDDQNQFSFLQRGYSSWNCISYAGFTWNSNILHWAVHDLITLHNFQVSHDTYNHPLKNSGFIWDMPFSKFKDSVETKDLGKGQRQ